MAIIVTVLVAAFLGWLVLRSSDDADVVVSDDLVTSTPEGAAAPDTAAPPSTETAPASTETAPVLSSTAETTSTAVPTTVEAPQPDTTVVDDQPDTDPPAEPDAPTTSSAESTAPPTTDPLTGLSYPTMPDGSPVPILGVYNGDVVSLNGNVPTQAAKDRLIALGLANSRSENPMLIDLITINPDVPIGIGVRVIDTGSSRFDAGSATITPELAAEYDRFIPILEAFPNVSLLIIGHSDQRGSEEQNFTISRNRAQAVNDYVVAKGISPLRITSRAVGEADLLTEADDEASLALNRRTEVVFYGLLIE